MLQEAAQCPHDEYQDQAQAQDLVYDQHLGEEELASGEFDTVEYEEYSYDVQSEKVFHCFLFVKEILFLFSIPMSSIC